jgi:two-component system nitrogen regulation sensor histidine kinase NtrY
MFEKFEWPILLRTVLLFITLSITAYCFVNGWYFYTFYLLAFIIYQFINIYTAQLKSHREFNQFIESIHSKDFSRYYNVSQSPTELRSLRKGFNEINSMFKTISREKETQYYYLQKVLELVDTGILSYDAESSEVIWMNETLKKLLNLPYLKTIHSFRSRDEHLYREILSLKPGESKIASLTSNNNTYQVLLSATFFLTDGKKINFIAFQNINEALEQTEAKAWQKLLNVITHEIMNSIAPISSLADTIKKRLNTIDITLNTNGSIEDLKIGVDAIKRRSEGLLKFANTYRNLNNISKPILQKLYVRDVFENLNNLMLPTLSKKGIELEIILKDPNLMLEVDINLIEQVLINLLVNAIEAVKDNSDPRIALSGYVLDNGKVVIKLSDNGTGIPEDLMENIFIPFFSTKKNGNGIGLTLCKQIMILHRGNIQVQSKKNGGTSFLLNF